MLKAGRTDMGARAASSHTGALAGNDKVYDDILRQSGVVRAPGLNDMLQYARGMPVLPTPKGENVVIITGAGGSGVLLSDACVDNGLTLMDIPDDLAAAFDEYIPPFGASGNPVDITGGEPPSTYRNTIALGLEDERIHALILGYWHTIVTPPMVFAELVAEVVEEYRAKGIEKPVVASLAGDVEVEEASEYLYDHGVVAYPYTTEMPVARARGEVPLGPQRRVARRLRQTSTSTSAGSETESRSIAIRWDRVERRVTRPQRGSHVRPRASTKEALPWTSKTRLRGSGQTPSTAAEKVWHAGGLEPMPIRKLPEAPPSIHILGPTVFLLALGVGMGESYMWPRLVAGLRAGHPVVVPDRCHAPGRGHARDVPLCHGHRREHLHRSGTCVQTVDVVLLRRRGH